MDLLPPKPDQLVSAASNVAHTVLYGGLADLRPMPRTLIDEGELREVYHYRPSARVTESGDPVLLVTPLAAPALCFDLRRGCSLVEHHVSRGRRTYLVEYGQVSFRNRGLGMEHWVDDVLPAAIRAVSEHAGGRPVHVVGWSLGGIFAMLTAADQPTLPIASLTIVGSPVDVTKVPLMAPVRPLLNLSLGGGLITRAYQALGGVPTPLVRWAFQLASVQKLITKPLALATHLDDADYLAQIEAVDRFTANMIAYPGRSFGQVYHRMIKGNALAQGSMSFGDRTIELAAIKAPVLVFGGANDSIAPIKAVRPVVEMLTGSRDVRFEIVPGGHLGMLTGRGARESTWQVMDEWIEEWSSPDPRRTPQKAATKQATTKKTTARNTAPKKTTAKKTSRAAKKVPAKKSAQPTARETPAKKTSSAKKAPARKAATKKTAAKKAADRTAIGVNPARRYGSASSRSLRS